MVLERIEPFGGVASVQPLLLADGRRLSVSRWPGGGDPVVILHGLLDSSEGWTRLCERISVPGVAFDLPGFGHSDPPPRGSISSYARDVAEGLTMLGVERFALVGHSLGGAVAAALAELMPSQVSSLVLFAPAGFGRIHLAEAAWIPGVRNVLQATLPLVLSSRFAVAAGLRTMVTNGNSPDRDLVARVIDRGGQLVVGVREGTRAVVNAGRNHDAFHRRRIGYDGPVCAVWGDRDRLVPVSHRHGLKAAFPQARIEVWYGMGHHPLSERFDDVLALVTNSRRAPSDTPQRRQASACGLTFWSAPALGSVSAAR
ncbi:MAG: alpha/beta fold hydrolase [Solirubrobacteraceae bacterium]